MNSESDNKPKSRLLVMKERLKLQRQKEVKSCPQTSKDPLPDYLFPSGGSDRSSAGSYTTSCFLSPLKSRKFNKSKVEKPTSKTKVEIPVKPRNGSDREQSISKLEDERKNDSQSNNNRRLSKSKSFDMKLEQSFETRKSDGRRRSNTTTEIDIPVRKEVKSDSRRRSKTTEMDISVGKEVKSVTRKGSLLEKSHNFMAKFGGKGSSKKEDNSNKDTSSGGKREVPKILERSYEKSRSDFNISNAGLPSGIVRSTTVSSFVTRSFDMTTDKNQNVTAKHPTELKLSSISTLGPRISKDNTMSLSSLNSKEDNSTTMARIVGRKNMAPKSSSCASLGNQIMPPKSNAPLVNHILPSKSNSYTSLGSQIPNPKSVGAVPLGNQILPPKSVTCLSLGSQVLHTVNSRLSDISEESLSSEARLSMSSRTSVKSSVNNVMKECNGVLPGGNPQSTSNRQLDPSHPLQSSVAGNSQSDSNVRRRRSLSNPSDLRFNRCVSAYSVPSMPLPSQQNFKNSRPQQILTTHRSQIIHSNGNEEFQVQKVAFFNHLAEKYPCYAERIKSPVTSMSKLTDAKKTKVMLGNSTDYVQSQTDLSSRLSCLSDMDSGSPVSIVSSGLGSCRELRSTLPVVRSPNKSMERPLGQVFLIYNNETKRSILPNEVTSIDTVKALFVRSFPRSLSMRWFDSPYKKIYILDPITNVFYELDDLGEIKDRVVLKIYEKDIIGSAATSPPRQTQPLEPTYETIRRTSNLGFTANHFPSLPGQPGYDSPADLQGWQLPPGGVPSGMLYGSQQAIGHMPPILQSSSECSSPSKGFINQRHSVAYLPDSMVSHTGAFNHLPLSHNFPQEFLNVKDPVFSAHSSGTITPCAGDVETKDRMQKMESQLANLAAWFQTAVNKNDKPGQTAAGLTNRPTLSGLTNQQIWSARSSMSDISCRSNLNLGTLNTAHSLKKQARELRRELAEVRDMQLSFAKSVNSSVQDVIDRLKLPINEMPDFKTITTLGSQQLTIRFTIQNYRQESVQTGDGLRELESIVEEIRRDVVGRKCRVNMVEVESLAFTLSQLSRSLAGLKAKFPRLQEKMKMVMENEMEVIIGEEKYLKEEPSKIEEALKRSKKLMGTLFTLKKLASVQDKRQVSMPFVATKPDVTDNDRKMLLGSIQAIVPDHTARLRSLEDALVARERKKKMTGNLECLRFEKTLELAQRQLRETDNMAKNSARQEKVLQLIYQQNQSSPPAPQQTASKEDLETKDVKNTLKICDDESLPADFSGDGIKNPPVASSASSAEIAAIESVPPSPIVSSPNVKAEEVKELVKCSLSGETVVKPNAICTNSSSLITSPIAITPGPSVVSDKPVSLSIASNAKTDCQFIDTHLTPTAETSVHSGFEKCQESKNNGSKVKRIPPPPPPRKMANQPTSVPTSPLQDKFALVNQNKPDNAKTNGGFQLDSKRPNSVLGLCDSGIMTSFTESGQATCDDSSGDENSKQTVARSVSAIEDICNGGESSESEDSCCSQFGTIKRAPNLKTETQSQPNNSNPSTGSKLPPPVPVRKTSTLSRITSPSDVQHQYSNMQELSKECALLEKKMKEKLDVVVNNVGANGNVGTKSSAEKIASSEKHSTEKTFGVKPSGFVGGNGNVGSKMSKDMGYSSFIEKSLRDKSDKVTTKQQSSSEIGSKMMTDKFTGSKMVADKCKQGVGIEKNVTSTAVPKLYGNINGDADSKVTGDKREFGRVCTSVEKQGRDKANVTKSSHTIGNPSSHPRSKISPVVQSNGTNCKTDKRKCEETEIN